MLKRRLAAACVAAAFTLAVLAGGGCRSASKTHDPGRAEPTQGKKKRDERPGLLTLDTAILPLGQFTNGPVAITPPASS